MRKTISFLVISNSGSSAKQVTTTRPFFWFLNFLVAVCFTFVSAVIYDYYNIKKSTPHTRELKSQIDYHISKIHNQRKQIQEFGGEINTLKSKLVTLNKFKDKIKIIANIKGSTSQESLFGVGGTIPEDLDINVPYFDDHTSLMRDMHGQIQQLDLISADQEVKFESLIKDLDNKQNLLASTPAIQPSEGWITSGFGYRTSPFTGLREFHKALDIANREGTPIIATADGIVTFVGKKGMLGNVITIDHGHGMVTRYGHVKKVLKNRGEAIKRGDTIALVGNTGRTTGPHLHYEVILNGIRINPNRYILN